MATAGAAAGRWRGERRFYSGMATLIGVAVFVGFAPTYYLRTLNDAPALHPRPCC